MQKQSFDTGLVSVFRLFTGIRFILALFGLVFVYSGLRPTFERQEISTWITIGESGVLLLYLILPGINARLGKWFLPIALAVSTLGPIASTIAATVPQAAPEITQARSLMSQWQLVIVLLMPLILVSWRYGFEAAVGYALVIDFVDITSLEILGPAMGIHPFLVFTILTFRTLFYLLIGYTITRLAAELRAQNTRLEQVNRQLASNALAQEQLAISRERNRLGRELHDTLAHTLSGIAVQLEAVEAIWATKPEQAHNLVKDVLVQTRRGLNEARRAIQALRAAPIEDLGLRMALEHLARNEAERGGLVLDLHLPERISGLNPEQEQTFYRVAEEAMRNAVHHAGARNLSMAVSQNESQLVLKIKDDGVGFNPQDPIPPDRFGLHGMKERAEAVDGQVRIESQPGQGTLVTLAVELKR